MSICGYNLRVDDIGEKVKQGHGSFGRVYKIKMKSSGQILALKVIDIGDKGQTLESAKMEYSILSKNLPNIVRSYDHHFDEKLSEYSYTMEYHPYDLTKYVNQYENLKKKPFTFDDFFPIFMDILRGKKGRRK